MTELLLNAILNLFALISSEQGEEAGQRCRRVVQNYLAAHVRLGDSAEYLGLFDELFDLALMMEPKARRQMAWNICDKLRGKMPRQEQIVALLNLMLLLAGADEAGAVASFGMIIASALDIEGELLDDLGLFMLHPDDHSRLTPRFLVLDNGSLPPDAAYKRLIRPDFRARWTMLSVADLDALFVMPTGGTMFIDNQPAAPGAFYVVGPGAILRDEHGATCYHAEIIGALFGSSDVEDISFVGEHLDYRFPGSDNGLHDFSFRETSGRLVGIMGGSGSGKSTLLSILSGTLKPTSGRVLVNGHDLYADGGVLEGLMGFVPQDDLLFDDLTVYQNLYFNAKLCLGDLLDEDELRERVEQTLTELDQYDIRDLKVGSPLDKTISGGQRKRLNIALELIRRPAILFADEPTSGLSSADSLNVVSLLKEQTLKGRLVIVVIHQPSSSIFKLLDTLWILDKGGRPVYAGNPLDSLTYFRSAVHLAGMGESVCVACGNVNPEQIFDILEMKVVDETGRFIAQRQISPEEWHRRHLERFQEIAGPGAQESRPTPRGLWKPGLWGQFKVFFERNLRARLANRQYILINLLEAPLIALVLALLCRFSPGERYVFMDNPHLSMFFFMSVIVAIFLGLSVSAEEIIKDRKILKREGFLRLSWFSYINSKAAYLTMLTAVQTLTFVLVGNAILEIPDLTIKTWAVLFSCGMCAALMGLNISASLRSVVAIYILVPLLLIPQMLLSGSVISFQDLLSSDAHENHVPWFANVMPSRWGYEALVVEQYSANSYQEAILEPDCRIRQADYMLESHLPELRSLADYLFINDSSPDRDRVAARNLRVLRHEVAELERLHGLSSGLKPGDFGPTVYNRPTHKKLKAFLTRVEKALREQRTAAFELRAAVQEKRLRELGRNGLEALKERTFNKNIDQVARNSLGLETLRVADDRLIQLSVPICKQADSPWGATQFLAGWKNLAGWRLPTFRYNLAFLWLLSILLYAALYLKLLPRLLRSVPAA